MWSIPNEDEYWERRREEYERVPKDWKPTRFQVGDQEPYHRFPVRHRLSVP